MRAIVLLACAGCLARPVPQGHSDGGDGDGNGDGGGDAAPDLCPWSLPVPMSVPSVPAGDVLAGPWLSDDLLDLWFAQLPSGDTSKSVIVRTRFDGSAYTMPAIFPPPTGGSNGNPLRIGNSLWYDSFPTTGGSRFIYEFDLVTSATVSHSELGMAKQPTLSPDGRSIYYSTLVGTSYQDARAGTTGAFMTPNPIVTFADQITSLSISNDGLTMYAADLHAFDSMLLYELGVGADHTHFTSARVVGTFQHPHVKYVDPNISRDGLTLVFASDFENPGSPTRLYYVTRSCTM